MSKDEINAFLGSGTAYEGKLTFQGAVRIDGHFSGEIISEGSLIIGKDALIEGTIDVGEFILSGTFKGDALVRRRSVFHKLGVFNGTLSSPALLVEDGALFNGTLSMQEKQNKT